MPARFALPTLSLPFLILIGIVCSCTNQEKYRIAVFQDIHTTWDQTLNDEIRREADFHPYVEFEFHSSAKNPQDGAQQIKKAVHQGVNAIIVNPYGGDGLVEAIEDAYDSGVYVVLVGQRINSPKYSSYIGTDNSSIGRNLATRIGEMLPDGGNIIKIGADSQELFYTERDFAFNHIIDENPNVNIVAELNADWDKGKAHLGLDSVKTVLGNTPVDIIVSFGGDMGIGAGESNAYPDARIVCVDGRENVELPAIKDGTLTMVLTNPCGGTKAVDTAIDILYGRPFNKENMTQPRFVDRNNVEYILEDNQAILNSNHRFDLLLNRQEQNHKLIKALKFGLFSVLTLLLIALIGVAHAMKRIKQIKENRSGILAKNEELEKIISELSVQKEVAQQSLKNLMAEREILLEMASESRNGKEETSKDPVSGAVFMNRFRQAVEASLDNSELSVDMLASELGVSRAQLFRRIKSDSGSTPNELIQAMRLDKADQLLKSADMTISEIAYAVGFSSPSYFSKCYKDKFGAAPSLK